MSETATFVECPGCGEDVTDWNENGVCPGCEERDRQQLRERLRDVDDDAEAG